MITLDSITFSQLAAIRQITLDETRLEAERRGCYVSAKDQVVCDNVCGVVLRNGAQLRESAQRAMASAPTMIPFPTEPKAACSGTGRSELAQQRTALGRAVVECMK